MGECLPCKQEVTSSTLVFSTRITDCALHSPFFCILGKFFPNIQKNAPLGIRHSDEMCSILELLDKEKSDKLCQIYATKKHPTARNL